MALTTLNELLVAHGARMGEYCGAESAANFGDVAAEFATLHSGCGVFDLARRAKFYVTGPDRLRWLNGMVTNNIRDLAPNHGTYNFVLNPQGRIQGDLYAYNRGEYLLLDTEACQRQKLQAFLDNYIIMDDVQLSSADEKIAALGITGPRAKDVLHELGMNTALEPLEIQDQDFKQMRVSLVRGEHSYYELWMELEAVSEVWNLLVEAGATPVGSDAIELARIAAGIPRYGVDIRDRDLPQETGQTQALNFSKGCYVGQEIVERIHSRGAVHRQFTGLIFEGPLPSPGAKISAGGREVGEVTSVASVPSANGARVIGLGYIRLEAVAAKTAMTVDGTETKLAQLPFTNI